MIPRTSQYHPGHEIPEKNLYYRLAKKFLFNDFGVYAGHDHTQTAAPFLQARTGPGKTTTCCDDSKSEANGSCCGSLVQLKSE